MSGLAPKAWVGLVVSVRRSSTVSGVSGWCVWSVVGLCIVNQVLVRLWACRGQLV